MRIVHTAFDAGVNFIDTADVYNQGESEDIIGKAIAGRRDDVVVATKCHHPMSEDVLNRRGSSRSWIVRACEDSLRRLGTDYIDLYQVHRPDPLTDIDETLGALVGPRAPGQGAHDRVLHVSAVGDRRGARGRGSPWPRAVPVQPAAVFDLRARHRA